jgi:hypothetical protein
MDADRFDTIARMLAARATRRRTLGGLLGAGLTVGVASAAADKHRNRLRKKRHQRRGKRGQPQAQGECADPGPGTNLDGCDFAGKDFSGRDLSGSDITDATFRNAVLVDTDLSGSDMARTSFRGANLCGAKLSSSSLANADFRGSSGSDGRPTNLTRADLRSSKCKGTIFDANTIFCGTKTCSGAVRNDGCPAGVDPEDTCCADADCPAGEVCQRGTCTCEGCRDGETCPAGDAWAQCGANGTPCRTCGDGQICAADSGTCVNCSIFTRVGGTFCEVRDAFSKYQCTATCRCAKATIGDGTYSVCFDGPAYCRRGPEQICEFPADCVIEGLGTDCIVVGDCEPGCRTACVTRCTEDEGSGGGPLQLVVLDS